jgi:hypothetical protein
MSRRYVLGHDFVIEPGRGAEARVPTNAVIDVTMLGFKLLSALLLMWG